MNTDIFNPTEYWTPESIPDGEFVFNGDETVSAEFVWERLRRRDWQNATEGFHRIVHYGISFGKPAPFRGETFQFFLSE